MKEGLNNEIKNTTNQKRHEREQESSVFTHKVRLHENLRQHKKSHLDSQTAESQSP